MRLIDIKKYINIAYNNFDLKFSVSDNYYIDNILQSKIAINALIESKILPSGYENEESLLNIIQSSFTDKIRVNSSIYSTYETISKHIFYMINCLHGWIDEYVKTEETDTTLNIKLPPINDLSDLSDTISLLEKSLNSISTINGGGKIKVEQLDHGSLWVIIAACSQNILVAIIAAINSALDIAKKKIELDQAKEILKRTKIENDAIENLVKLQKHVIAQLIEEQAENTNYKIPEEANGLTEGEQKNRYKKSLEELTQLIAAGTEFHPALCASSEIQNSFPDFKQIVHQGPLTELPREEKGDKNNTKRE